MSRHTAFKHREQAILETAEHLLLESLDGNLTLDELSAHLDIAKGTLYKHFSSKDELYMNLLIRHEHKLYQINRIDDSAGAALVRVMLSMLLAPTLTMLYVRLEERLSGVNGLNRLFDELYQIRYERMDLISDIGQRYLDEFGSAMPLQDFLVGLHSLAQGGSSLLNSSFNQRYLGARDVMIFTLIEQALALPKLAMSVIAPRPPVDPATPKTSIHPSVNLPPL